MSTKDKIDKITYSAQIAGIVRDRIRKGKLRSGDHISEAALAEECGISRAPVREALYLLEAEGFLDSHPGKGKIIKTFTSNDIRHRYELCGILEGAAAGIIVGQNPGMEYWSRLESILSQMQQNVENCAPLEVHAELGTEFHEAFLAPVENRLLVNTARSTCRVISKYLLYQEWRTMYSPKELYLRHQDIYNALRTTEQMAVEKAIRNHYAESAERMAECAKILTHSVP